MQPNMSPAPPKLPTPRRTYNFSPRMENPNTPAAEARGQHFFNTPTAPGPVGQQPMEEDTVIPLAENNIDLLVARFGAMPAKLPDGVKGQTPAVGIITQFERVIIVEGHTYSPYREWTTARRKAANISKTQSTLFGRKCRMYAYVRSQPDVVALPVKVRELERDANAWIKSLSEEEQVEWKRSSYDSAVAVWTALKNV